MSKSSLQEQFRERFIYGTELDSGGQFSKLGFTLDDFIFGPSGVYEQAREEVIDVLKTVDFLLTPYAELENPDSMIELELKRGKSKEEIARLYIKKLLSPTHL